MMICSDWPTTLKCGITLGYKKDDGAKRRRVKVVEDGRRTTDERQTRVMTTSARVDNEKRGVKAVVIAIRE